MCVSFVFFGQIVKAASPPFSLTCIHCYNLEQKKSRFNCFIQNFPSFVSLFEIQSVLNNSERVFLGISIGSTMQNGSAILLLFYTSMAV